MINITTFMILMIAFSTISSLCTQAVKNMLDDTTIKYSSNILACVVACIVGACGMSVYYILNDITFSLQNIVLIFVMGITSSVGSMVGYDKVMQAIKQLSGNA